MHADIVLSSAQHWKRQETCRGYHNLDVHDPSQSLMPWSQWNCFDLEGVSQLPGAARLLSGIHGFPLAVAPLVLHVRTL